MQISISAEEILRCTERDVTSESVSNGVVLMNRTRKGDSGWHNPNGMLFVGPVSLSSAFRLGRNSKRNACIRRPRHGGLQTNTMSGSFVGGMSENGLVTTFHECIPGTCYGLGTNFRSGEIPKGGNAISMSRNRRWEEEDDERIGREEEGRWQVNNAGEEAPELRDAFSSSRAEWGDESSEEGLKSDTRGGSYKGWQRSEVAASSYAEWKESELVAETFSDVNEKERCVSDTVAKGKRRGKEKKEETLTVISGGDLMKKVVGVPAYLLREIVVPISEVGSVLWYDMKMSVIDGLTGEQRYFVDDVTEYDTDYNGTEEDEMDMEAEEERLSVEERQILEVQQSATRAANKIQGTMIRLFGRLF